MITLSAQGFVLGTDFSCTQSYCEPRGLIASGAYRALQAGANSLSTRLGVGTQIVVDGRIGQQTVNLIKALAVKVAGSTSTLATYWDTSKEELSRDAAMVAAEIGLLLQSNASGGGAIAPPGTPPAIPSGTKPNTAWAGQIVPSAGGVQPPQAGTTITPVGPTLIPQTKTKYILGGVAVLIGTVTAGLAISRLRKRSSGGVSGARPRKTRDEYVVQANYGYGHGWEDATAENTRSEAKQRLREYRENAPEYAYRLVKKRVRI